METAGHHYSSPPPFAQALRAFRLDRRLTQEQLAERAGMSVRTVRNAETGRVGAPRRESIGRLAVALNLSIEDRRRLATAAAAARSLLAHPAGRPPEVPLDRPADVSTVVHLDADTPVRLVVGPAVIELHLMHRLHH